jgi:hypothetical protein
MHASSQDERDHDLRTWWRKSKISIYKVYLYWAYACCAYPNWPNLTWPTRPSHAHSIRPGQATWLGCRDPPFTHLHCHTATLIFYRGCPMLGFHDPPSIHSGRRRFASSLLLRPGHYLRGTVADVTRGEWITVRPLLLLRCGC